MKNLRAGDLRYSDRFYYDSHLWQHCGWYSAVYHICGYGLKTGEHRVISCHAFVTPFEGDTYCGGLGI